MNKEMKCFLIDIKNKMNEIKKTFEIICKGFFKNNF